MKYSSTVSDLLFPLGVPTEAYRVRANAILSGDERPITKFVGILHFQSDVSMGYCRDDKGEPLYLDFPVGVASTSVADVYAATMVAHHEHLREFFELTAASIAHDNKQGNFSCAIRNGYLLGALQGTSLLDDFIVCDFDQLLFRLIFALIWSKHEDDEVNGPGSSVLSSLVKSLANHVSPARKLAIAWFLERVDESLKSEKAYPSPFAEQIVGEIKHKTVTILREAVLGGLVTALRDSVKPPLVPSIP